MDDEYTENMIWWAVWGRRGVYCESGAPVLYESFEAAQEAAEGGDVVRRVNLGSSFPGIASAKKEKLRLDAKWQSQITKIQNRIQALEQRFKTTNVFLPAGQTINHYGRIPVIPTFRVEKAGWHRIRVKEGVAKIERI